MRPGPATSRPWADPRRPLGLLHERSFRLLWIGETTSTLGTTVSKVALPLVAVVTLHASAFEVSLLTAAAWLPWLLVGLPAGAWIDRVARRPVMIVCDAVSAGLVISVPIAAWAGVLTLAHLVIVALVTGAVAVFFETAYQVYQAELVAAPHLVEANGKLQGSAAVSQVAGPGLAGLLAQLGGPVTGLVADGFSFLVSGECLRAISERPNRVVRPDGPPTRLRQQVADGLRFLARDGYLRVLTVFGAISNLALTGYQSILIVFLVRDVGVDAGTVGLLISGASLGGVLGASIAGPVARRWGSARGLLLIAAGPLPLALLIPMTAQGLRLLFVVVGGIAIGCSVVAGNIIKSSFRQQYCPHELLARVTVGMQFLNYGAIPAGALLGGSLAGALGLRPTLWIMVIGVVLAPAILFLGPIRHRRELPVRPSKPAPAPAAL